MAGRKTFLLRISPELHGTLQKWADDELRSLNGQIEFLLRSAVKSAGRQPKKRRQERQDREPDSR